MSSYVFYAAFMAALVPLALITTRRELRKVRIALIQDLKSTLLKGENDLPQIELVEMRYRLAASGGSRQDGLQIGAGALFFFAIGLIGFLILMLPREALVSPHSEFPALPFSLLWSSMGSEVADVWRALTIIGIAFLGGYVAQGRYLIRTVLNQELSALAFVRSTMAILQSMITAAVFFRIVDGGFDRLTETEDFGFSAMMVAAFVIGLWPNLGLSYVVMFARIRTKRVDEEAVAESALIPLEVIDGIDRETSFRLEESNLFDVQNLATMNPLQLYAETPYSLHQIFDWVLQAQLCNTVGPRLFRELRKHGIRTIFDLERAVIAQGAPDSYVAAIGAVLLKDTGAPFYQLLEPWGDGDDGVDPEVVRHVVAILIDDLHIHHLRALWHTMIRATSQGGKPAWLYETQPLPGDKNFPVANPRERRKRPPIADRIQAAGKQSWRRRLVTWFRRSRTFDRPQI